MSYDFSLRDKVTGETIEFPEAHQLKGGTYALGGTKKAELNVTYNYSSHFYRVMPPLLRPDGQKIGGIRCICGLTGAESIPVLKAAAEQLGTDEDQDYWKPTEGNARAALLDMITLAAMAPDGVWGGG